MKKVYSTIIFDFDGTIADSLRVLLRAYTALSDELSLKELSEQDVAQIRSMPPLQMLKYLGIPLYRIPQLLMRVRAKYKDFMGDLEPVAGIPFVLMELEKQYDLHILTSNDQESVLTFLNTHEISCFDSVTSEKNLFGKDRSLRKVLKQLRLDASYTLYIGDEVRDIEACHNVGVDVCSVAWGFNSYEILEQHKPTYLLQDPKELLTLLI